MTRGRPEPEPNAAAGDRGRNDRRAVPGWDADQDWNSGPAYEDTGWHLDLSDVNWGRGQGPRDSAPMFGDEDSGNQSYRDRNAPGQPPVSEGRPAEVPPGWDERPGRRPGRHSRPHPEAHAGLPGSSQSGPTQSGPTQSGPTQPGPGPQRRVAGRSRAQRRDQPDRADRARPEPGYAPGPYSPPVYEELHEPPRTRPADPRVYQPDDYRADSQQNGPGYEDRTPTRRNRRPAPQTGDFQTGDYHSGDQNSPGNPNSNYQPSNYQPSPGYEDRTPTRRNRRPAPQTGDFQTGDYQSGDQNSPGNPNSNYQPSNRQDSSSYEDRTPTRRNRREAPGDYQAGNDRTGRYGDPRAERPPPGSYRTEAYGEAGVPGQTRPYLPEGYPQPGGQADPYAGDPPYSGDTQQVRGRAPDAYQQRQNEPAPDRGPHGYRSGPPGEPDYDGPDYDAPDAYEAEAYDLDPHAADYQTDIFELTGYGQAVPGLPPPGLPPPPRTRPRPPGPPPAGLERSDTATRAPTAASAENVDVVRSSGVMAAGTLGSRLTGFVRTLVQNFAIGVVGIGQAYNLSNTLPNVVYNLALGGILTSVVVPLIVAAAKRDSDRGRGYDQRMFTLGTFALAGITIVATALAVPIVHLYSGSKVTGNVEHLAIIFALFFIPQIFFYGISSLIGAILNSRGSFSAPMWTPIVNNVVVLAVFGLYVAMAGVHKTPGTISGSDVALLGFGTTLGIVAQTAALVPAMRRVGFRWNPRLDFRRSEVTEIGRMGSWMFCYIAATQVAFLVTTKVAGDTTSGISDYNYAWLLFQLPYAVVGISVITALLPRMSAHASERRLGLVRADFSTGVRLAATIVVPCSLILAVLGPAIGQAFFGHFATNALQGRYVGVVFAVFCLGLLPYMIFQLQLRVFYSMHDSKTPAMIGLVTMVVNIAANLVALAMLSNRDLVAGLGVGFGLANLTGLILASRILSVRLRGLDGYRIGRSLVRMHAATLPAALLAVLIVLVSSNAYVDVIIGGGLAMVVYLVFGRALRIEELAGLTRTVRARLGR